MSITSDSTVEEIWNYVGRPGDVEVDVDNWSILDCNGLCTDLTIEKYTLKFGGFYFDAFYDFTYYCIIAGTHCFSAIDYDYYDGWAKGIYTRF